MSKDFQTIWVQMRRPRDGDPGVTEPGYFRVEDDTIVLVDKNGIRAPQQKRKTLDIQIKTGPERSQNCGAIDTGPSAGLPRRLSPQNIYPNLGNSKWLFMTNSATAQ